MWVLMTKRKVYQLGDVVEMKKQHPCGTNRMKIIRMGMDIRIKCDGCAHSILMPRSQFDKNMRKVLVSAEPADSSDRNE